MEVKKLNNKARVIAFYLPQFHPVPENDKMWGKGFTEWTNVANAKPLFKGHYQPQIPADLGFYDLRLKEVRNAQAELAREAGIEGFCYWHYWFGNGKKILDMPFNEVLNSKEPNYPFCLAWANHSWSNKTWQKTKGITKDIEFIKQEYLGKKDYEEHFYSCLKAFKDERYIKVEGKPLFLIYSPKDIPSNKEFIDCWNRLAKENGLKGIYFVARLETFSFSRKENIKNYEENANKLFNYYISEGYNAISPTTLKYADIKAGGYLRKMIKTFLAKYVKNVFPETYEYGKIIKYLYSDLDKQENVFPQLLPRWDKTPRKGRDAQIYINSTPEKFGESIDLALDKIKNKEYEHKILFLFAWNEWGEGAYMEPDIKFGHGYLDMLKKKIIKD